MPKSLPRRFQVLVLLIGGLVTFLFLTNNHLSTHSIALYNHPYFHYNLSTEEPRDPNQSCVIPKLHPFDDSILSYVSFPKPIKCKVRIPTLTYIDEFGWLKYNNTALHESGYSVKARSFISSLSCYWRPVLRGGLNQTDDDSVTYGEKVKLEEEGSFLSHAEVVMVTCKNFAGFSIYQNIHAHIRDISDLKPQVCSNQTVNVLIIGLDSMSRQAFIRLMPLTYRYLTEVLNFSVITGMNKVGDNTYPNLVAFLTGKKAYGHDLPSDSSGFDDWPLIWRNYSSAGYVTLWAEDFPDFGLFNYLAKGFKKPPVHHYLRPFWLAVKESSLLRTSSHMCFGNIPRHKLQLDYVQRFVRAYSTKCVPYFSFSFLTELSHEYLSRVAVADLDFENLFKFLQHGGHLQNTLVIMMSDHGHRFDAIRSTQIGRLEERLPFFAMHVPENLLPHGDKSRVQLKTNTVRLVTPYDTYATMMDVLNHVTTNTELGSYHPEFGYGRTLFGSIPANRTCKDAGIPVHYCTCTPEASISADDQKVSAAVRAVFNLINGMLNNFQQLCAQLLPGKVLNAQLLKGTKDSDTSRINGIIRVTISALPSEAIFEATVEIRTSNEIASLQYDAKVLGDVSRINKYGDQSSCISHNILRKYCFCKN